MRKNKIIFDNRSSKPIYASAEAAFDLYYLHYNDGHQNFAAVRGDFKFYVRTNKNSVTIQIYDR